MKANKDFQLVNPPSKKSQIQMGESVAILFIFFILLVFGFVFYMNVMGGSAKVELEENIQLKAIKIAQMASFLPELQCSEENVREEGCIDIRKLGAFSNLLEENKIYYYDIFEFSRIYVKGVFPKEDFTPPKQNEWEIYKKELADTNNNLLTDYTTKMSTFIPVSLFDATSKKYSFGYLVVEVYQ